MQIYPESVPDCDTSGDIFLLKLTFYQDETIVIEQKPINLFKKKFIFALK